MFDVRSSLEYRNSKLNVDADEADARIIVYILTVICLWKYLPVVDYILYYVDACMSTDYTRLV